MRAGIASKIAGIIRTQGIDETVIPQVVGAAVAYCSKTPSSGADSAITFWRQNLEQTANSAISEIGEQLIFNISLTAAIAKECYTQRVANFWSPCATGVAFVAEWTPQARNAYRETYALLCEEFGCSPVVEGAE